MQTLRQLIAGKAAAVFISDENSGWLPITVLLIISLSFDLCYDCSVRRTHLFICFAWCKTGTFFGGEEIAQIVSHEKRLASPRTRTQRLLC